MAKQKDKTYLFEEMPIPKAVLEMCIPTVMATLVMVLYNLADTYFVGMLNDPVQTAAVTLAAPIILLFNAVNNLFGVGTSSMMSRALGRKDYDTVRGSAAFSFYSSIACALFISAIYLCFKAPMLAVLGADEITIRATEGYMLWTVVCGAVPAILNVVMSNMVRAEGYSAHAGIGVMSGCILNIILDPFFILPGFLGMGAAGAGLATFLSNCVACIYFLVVLFLRRKNTYISISPKRFFVPKEVVLGIFGVGIPSAIQNILNVTGMTILNNFVSGYGADAVSAMGISHKMTMIPMYVCMGIAQGILPLVSYNYTSGNRKRMKDSIIYVGKISVGLGAVLAAVAFIFSGSLIRMFMTKPEIIHYGSAFLRAMSIGIPFLAMDFLGVGIYQALGKGRYNLIFAIFRKIVLEIPAIIILNMIYPLYGMAYSQPVAEVILAVAAFLLLQRILDEPTGMDTN